MSRPMVFLLLIFYLVKGSAMPLAPRMWKAVSTREGVATTFYILGATHLGLDTEHDDYFRHQVGKAFLHSDDLIFETGGNKAVEQQAHCQVPLSQFADPAILQELRHDVSNLVYQYQRLLPSLTGTVPASSEATDRAYASVYTDGLSEFGLVSALQFYATVINSQSPRASVPGGGSRAARKPIAEALLEQRPEIRVESLDGSDDIAQSYCALGPERINYLKTRLLAFQRADAPADRPNADAALEQLTRQVQASVEHGTTFNPDAAPDAYLTAFGCLRNEKWIQRAFWKTDGRVHFVVAGLSHLFPIEGSRPLCDGLLRDLERIGFRVTRVE